MSLVTTLRKRFASTSGHSRVNLIIKATTSCLLLVVICLSFNFSFRPEHPNQNLQTPQASIRTITGNVTLSSLNMTSATHGDDVIVYGHAQVWNGGTFMWDPYIGGEIYLVADDVPKTGVTTTTDSFGDFALQFTVEPDWSVTADVKIEANITQSAGYDTFCYTQLYLDVDSSISILLDEETSTTPLLPGLEGKAYENYRISGAIELSSGSTYSGPSFEMEFWYGDLGTGQYYKNITVQPDGRYYDFVEIRTQYSTYILHWDGDSNLIGDTKQGTFHTISDIGVEFNMPRRMYINQSNTITIIVHQDTDDTVLLRGSNVTVQLVGPSTNIIDNYTLTAGGSYIFTPVVFDYEGEYTLTVTVIKYMSEWGPEEVPITWTVQSTFTVRTATVFTNIPWQFIVIGVAAAGAIVGIVILQRWLMKRRVKKDRSKIAADIEARLNNVAMLYRMGRIKEALAYLYVTYTDIALFKYGIEKESSQTTTEFAIVMVKQFGQNPQNIYPFIQEIEQVIYGGFPFNDQIFNQSIELFGRIYLELMERPLPTFQLS